VVPIGALTVRIHGIVPRSLSRPQRALHPTFSEPVVPVGAAPDGVLSKDSLRFGCTVFLFSNCVKVVTGTVGALFPTFTKRVGYENRKKPPLSSEAFRRRYLKIKYMFHDHTGHCAECPLRKNSGPYVYLISKERKTNGGTRSCNLKERPGRPKEARNVVLKLLSKKKYLDGLVGVWNKLAFSPSRQQLRTGAASSIPDCSKRLGV
jgi:hypothetical protein